MKKPKCSRIRKPLLALCAALSISLPQTALQAQQRGPASIATFLRADAAEFARVVGYMAYAIEACDLAQYDRSIREEVVRRSNPDGVGFFTLARVGTDEAAAILARSKSLNAFCEDALAKFGPRGNIVMGATKAYPSSQRVLQRDHRSPMHPRMTVLDLLQASDEVFLFVYEYASFSEETCELSINPNLAAKLSNDSLRRFDSNRLETGKQGAIALLLKAGDPKLFCQDAMLKYGPTGSRVIGLLVRL